MSMIDSAVDARAHPQMVASRYLQLMVAGREQKKRADALLNQLKEALATIRYFGVREKNRAEELQLLDVEQRGNTRRASTAARLHDLAAAGNALDANVRHWEEEVIGKCDILMDLAQERLASGDYIEAFLDLSRKLVDEVRSADWTAAPPRPTPWESIPTLFSPALVSAARATSSATSVQPSDGSFVIAAEWSGVAPREVPGEEGADVEVSNEVGRGHNAAGASPTTAAPADLNSSATSAPEASNARTVKALSVSCFAASIATSSPSATFSDAALAAQRDTSVRLNFSCCCVDEAEPNLSTLYLGTERGVIFAVPLEAVFPTPDEKKTPGADRTVQAALRSLLHQRSRLHEESTNLTSMRRMFGSGDNALHTESAGLPLDPARAAAASTTTPNSQFFLQEGPVKMFRGHVVAVNSLFLISHRERGKLLVSSSADKTVRLFNASTGAVVGIIGPEQAVCSKGIGYLKGPDAIVTAHFDGSVKVWGVQSGELVRTILELPKCPIHCCHVLPDIQPAADIEGVEGATSYTILLGCRNGHVYGVRVLSLPPRSAAAFTEELSPVAVQVAHVLLPDSAAGGLLSGPSAPVVRGGHTKAVLCMASVACFLFTGDAEGKVIKWDLRRQEKMLVFHQHIDDITTISCTSDGYLFTASRDGLWIVWNAENGTVVQRLGKHYHQVVGLAVGYREQPDAAAAIGGASSPTDGSTKLAVESAASSPVVSGTSPHGSPVSATGATSPSKTRRKKKVTTSASSDTPFPMIPKLQRMQPPGSREVVAMRGYQASDTQEWVHPLVVSVSKDDSLVAWQWTPKSIE